MGRKMDFEKINKQKLKFVTKLVGNELMLVPLKKSVANMDEMFSMNETAAFLYYQIDHNSTEVQLCESLENEFDVSESDYKKDVSVFLTELIKFMSKVD